MWTERLLICFTAELITIYIETEYLQGLFIRFSMQELKIYLYNKLPPLGLVK